MQARTDAVVASEHGFVVRRLGLQRPLLRLQERHASVRPDHGRPIPAKRRYQ